jgi:hypothetical protein
METCPLPGGLEIEFRMATVKFKSERIDALAAAGSRWQRRDHGIPYQGVMKKRLRA